MGIKSFVRIALTVLLCTILSVLFFRLFTTAQDQSSTYLRKNTEAYTDSYGKEIDELIADGEDVPITTIYKILMLNEGRLASMHLVYYKTDGSDNLIQTEQTVDFSKGGEVNGTVYNAEDYKIYSIGQLRYLFAEKATIDGEMNNEGLYDINIVQEERALDSTTVS